MWIYTKLYRRKEEWKRWVFNFLRKREVERSDTGEFKIGGVTWWTTWRRWNGRLFHETGLRDWKLEDIKLDTLVIVFSRWVMLWEKSRAENYKRARLSIIRIEVVACLWIIYDITERGVTPPAIYFECSSQVTVGDRAFPVAAAIYSLEQTSLQRHCSASQSLGRQLQLSASQSLGRQLQLVLFRYSYPDIS